MRHRAAAAFLGLVLLVLISADLSRVPERQLSTRAALLGLGAYQRFAAPVLSRSGVVCRFEPTCSRYASVVIARDGAVRGGLKTGRRLIRCGPWTPAGTVDPP